jgi:putative MFS transporter
MSIASSAAAGPRNEAAEKIVARIERLPTSWWHVKTRIIVGVATFFDAFDALAIATVLPVLAPQWQLTPPQIGLLISAGFLGQLAGALFFGWIAERYGRMSAMIASIATFAVMSLVCALAWNYHSLLAFRLIQGIGLGGEVPVAAVYISELTKAHNRGRFVLLYELVFPIGLTAASLVGLWVVPRWGWQWMFVIGALPALLALALRWLLPESPRWLATRGRTAEAEAVVSLIERETERSTGRPLPPVMPVVAAIDRPASWSDLFGPLYLRRTLVVWVIWFAAYFVNYGLSIWLSTLYRVVFQLPLDVALRYSLMTQAAGLVGTLICALSIDRVGRRPWFTGAFACAAVALALLWWYGTDSAERVLVYVTIAYFFISTINLGVYVYTPELYPTRARAFAVGTATAWLRFASMIGPYAVGLMIGARLTPTQAVDLPKVFLAFGAVAALAAVITGLYAIETKGRVLEEVSP